MSFEPANAADRRLLRAQKKAEKQAEATRRDFIVGIMSNPAGRDYLHTFFTRCHIWTPSFNTDALVMSFCEGERNVALQILADVMKFAPDRYITMMREANDRSIATDSGHLGDNSDRRRADSAGEPDGSGSDSDDDDDRDPVFDQYGR